MLSLVRALFLLVWCVSLPVRTEEDLSAFIDQTIAAYGGAQALQKASTVLSQGRVTSAARGGREGVMARLASPPMRLRVEVMYGPGDGELRVVDGPRGWRDGVAVTGPALEAMQLQAARLELPLSLLDRRAIVRDVGSALREGVRVRVLELPLSGTMSLLVEIDASTHRIVRSMGRTTGPRPLDFVTSYFDYRKVNGVLFAFTEKNLAMGRPTGDTVFEKIELLPEAPRDSFGPVEP